MISPVSACRKAYRYLHHRRERRKLYEIYRKYSTFTMIKPDNYVLNLELARQVRNVPGAIVECGVWRGGMIAGMAEVLGNSREYILFDSFEGLPKAKEIDGPSALAWQSNTTHPGYYDN